MTVFKSLLKKLWRQDRTNIQDPWYSLWAGVENSLKTQAVPRQAHFPASVLSVSEPFSDPMNYDSIFYDLHSENPTLYVRVYFMIGNTTGLSTGLDAEIPLPALWEAMWKKNVGNIKNQVAGVSERVQRFWPTGSEYAEKLWTVCGYSFIFRVGNTVKGVAPRIPQANDRLLVRFEDPYGMRDPEFVGFLEEGYSHDSTLDVPDGKTKFSDHQLEIEAGCFFGMAGEGLPDPSFPWPFFLEDFDRFDGRESWGFYAERKRNTASGVGPHNGQDLGCPKNTALRAAGPGVIKELFYDVAGCGTGMVVQYDDDGAGNGYYTKYCHLWKPQKPGVVGKDSGIQPCPADDRWFKTDGGVTQQSSAGTEGAFKVPCGHSPTAPGRPGSNEDMTDSHTFDSGGKIGPRTIKQGDRVVRGQVIALTGGVIGEYGAGSTGGAHLHIMFKKKDGWVDPKCYFQVPLSMHESHWEQARAVDDRSYDPSGDTASTISRITRYNSGDYKCTTLDIVDELTLLVLTSKHECEKGQWTAKQINDAAVAADTYSDPPPLESE